MAESMHHTVNKAWTTPFTHVFLEPRSHPWMRLIRYRTGQDNPHADWAATNHGDTHVDAVTVTRANAICCKQAFDKRGGDGCGDARGCNDCGKNKL